MLNAAILLAAASRRPAAGGGSFLPSDLAGLVLWLDADDPASLTLDGSNRVSQWADKSGQGAHAQQSNTSHQPTYVASGIAGRGSLDFGGVSYLNLPDLSGVAGSQNRSAFVVFEHFDQTDQGYLLALGHASSGTAGAAWRVSIHGNGDLRIEVSGANYDSALAPGTLASQIAVVLDGSSVGDHTLYLDGTSESASGGNLVDTGFGEASISQQNRGGPGGFVEDKAFDGYISEILVYTSALSQTDRQAVEGYLAHKWDVTAKLPSNHPYKVTAP